MYRILSIDGGGARGLVPARILAHLENRLIQETGNKDLRLCDVFDFVAGTSAGGVLALIYSLPATPDGRKYTATQIWQKFMNMLPGVFSSDLWKKINTVSGLFGNKYDATRFEKQLRFLFGRAQLSDVSIPCLVTAYDFIAQTPIYFKSHQARDQLNDNFFLFDVARATSAAPSYFSPHRFSDVAGQCEYFCSDGILFAYSPALAAYAEVRRLSGQHNAAHMQILSLGTGYRPGTHDIADISAWGGLHWGATIGKLMADCSALNVDEQLKQIFHDSPQNYTRINPVLDSNCSVDMDCITPENIDALNHMADQCVQEHIDIIDTVVEEILRQYADSGVRSLSQVMPPKYLSQTFPPKWSMSVSNYIGEDTSDHSKRIAIERGNNTIDYAGLDDRVRRLSNAMHTRLGIGHQSRVLLALSDELLILLLVRALTSLGAVISVYPRQFSDLNLAQELDRGMAAVFVDARFCQVVEAVCPQSLPLVWVEDFNIFAEAGESAKPGQSSTSLLPALWAKLTHATPVKAPKRAVALGDLFEASIDAPSAFEPGRAQDWLWSVPRTQKIYSQRNFVAGAAALLNKIPDPCEAGLDAPVFVIALASDSHTALLVYLLLAPRTGARVIFAPLLESGVSGLADWHQHKNLYIFAQPDWYLHILTQSSADINFPDLRFALSVGEGWSESLAGDWYQRSGCRLDCGWLAHNQATLLGILSSSPAHTDIVEPLSGVEYCAYENGQQVEDGSEQILVSAPQLPEWLMLYSASSTSGIWCPMDDGMIDAEGRLCARPPNRLDQGR